LLDRCSRRILLQRESKTHVLKATNESSETNEANAPNANNEATATSATNEPHAQSQAEKSDVKQSSVAPWQFLQGVSSHMFSDQLILEHSSLGGVFETAPGLTAER
jgi:hypothetical protein